MICTVVEVNYDNEADVTTLVVEHPDGTRHDYEVPGLAAYPQPGMAVVIEDPSPEELPN